MTCCSKIIWNENPVIPVNDALHGWHGIVSSGILITFIICREIIWNENPVIAVNVALHDWHGIVSSVLLITFIICHAICRHVVTLAQLA